MGVTQKNEEFPSTRLSFSHVNNALGDDEEGFVVTKLHKP